MKHALWIFTSISLFLFISCKMTSLQENHILFVGTYTDNGSEGIYSYTFNTDNGQLTNKTLAAILKNPSYLKIASNKKHLYAVSEVADFEGENGAVAAFEINEGALTRLNIKSTMGEHPCHVSLSENGSLVAVSNYTGGSIVIYETEENGSLRANPQFIDHKQLDTAKTSHAHSAHFIKNKIFVADLGLDIVKRYQFKDGKFSSVNQPTLNMVSGAGPRHFAFGQEEKFLYVINELNSTITVFEKNSQDEYETVETKSTLDAAFNGESYCADIHLAPDGQFLYGSNRGENTIVIFQVHSQTGKLSLVGREGVRGDWPRNFNMDPTGKFLLVANQRSNNISVYKRDLQMGILEYLYQIELPSPVCLEFLE
ncbi:MAG: lactonase family protein [Maribacter sp.]